MPNMTNYETQHSSDEFTNHSNNIEYYNEAKQELINAVNNNIHTIILYGRGGNGKSHLTTELTDFLNTNGYTIMGNRVERPLGCFERQKDYFISKISTPEKKLIHTYFDVFEHYNYQLSQSHQTINMDHIRF